MVMSDKNKEMMKKLIEDKKEKGNQAQKNRPDKKIGGGSNSGKSNQRIAGSSSKVWMEGTLIQQIG